MLLTTRLYTSSANQQMSTKVLTIDNMYKMLIMHSSFITTMMTYEAECLPKCMRYGIASNDCINIFDRGSIECEL